MAWHGHKLSSVEVVGTTTASAEDTAAPGVKVRVHDVPRTGISQAVELDAGDVRFLHDVHFEGTYRKARMPHPPWPRHPWSMLQPNGH